MTFITTITWWGVISPVIVCALLLFASYNKWLRRIPLTTKLNCDILTFFLLIATPFFMTVELSYRYVLYFILSLFLLAGIVVFFYGLKKGEIIYSRAFLLYWRVLFIFLVCVYGLLYIFGLLRLVL